MYLWSMDCYKIYLKDIDQFDQLDLESESLIVSRIKSGDDSARIELVQGTLPFVIWFAKKYRSFVEFTLLDTSDLVQSGNLGLIEAAVRFDPVNFDNKFTTYAFHYVRKAMKDTIIDYIRGMCVPRGALADFLKLSSIKNVYMVKHGRAGSIGEIITDLNWSELKFDAIYNAFSSVHFGSLSKSDESIQFGDDQLLKRLDADMELEDLVSTSNLVKRIAFESLMDRDYKVLMWRCEGLTLKTIGKDKLDGLTKERVRQIEARALRKTKEAVNKHFAMTKNKAEIAQLESFYESRYSPSGRDSNGLLNGA